MRKLQIFISLFGIFCCLNGGIKAQCTGIRYHNYLFADSVKSDITFGVNKDYNGMVDTLKMDVHFPKSDPSPVNRPLIIWLHAGNFIEGDKADQDVLPLCQAFTKMGYVTASLNYRLGMENYPGPSNDSLPSMRAVIRGMQDGRAAIRFFRNSYANGNQYGIDTSNIFVGGLSTGGIVALHMAYLTQMTDFPVWCDTTQPGMSGGLIGKSGTLVYTATATPVSSNIKAVISICGAVGDTSWMHPGSVPVISFHGNLDKTVPYQRGRMILSSDTLQTVCGGNAVMQRANHVGLTNCFKEYVGQDQLPEVAITGDGPAFLDTTMNLVRNFLGTFVCGDVLACTYQNPLNGIGELNLERVALHCYPNPVGNQLSVDLSDFQGAAVEVMLLNTIGQQVAHYTGVRTTQLTIDRGQLSPGLYLVSVVVQGKRLVSRIVFE
jgi:para-nitrobenzyl esterase